MAEKYLTYNPSETIDEVIKQLAPDVVLIVTDSNVDKAVLPKLADSSVIKKSNKYVFAPGEENKNLETVIKVWQSLEKAGATRRSVILNIGGGVVTDLGGFAAATFKRGIRTVNFPTTLLGAVDAATGGKTGIDFNGLKNEIGAFHLPSKVIVSPIPFTTLPYEEIISGYAEMIKTALISDRHFYISLLDMDRITENNENLGIAVEKCVLIKENVVAQDPTEKGLRKILNFGHTAGHALESLRIENGNPVTHGKAVAHGILVALILSHMKLGFESMEVNYYKNFLKKYYGSSLMRCQEMDRVLEIMASDKKNQTYGEPLFTLLRTPGTPEIDCKPTHDEIKEALELYIDMTS